jgi:hypothetical protein
MYKQYLLILFCVPFFANAQFNVGNSDGFASSCYMQADFPIASIFSVGNDDGFAKDCYTQNDFAVASIYSVGNDDGFAKDCYTQNDFAVASIYSVGNDDGFAKDCYTQNDFAAASIYSVGNDDGFAKDCYTQNDIAFASIYSVGNDDGFGKSCLGSLNNEVPLPIELLSFTAECNEQNIILKWVTLTEKNNAYFTIEKSFDGLNWEIVAKINGSGNSYTPKEYQYKDKIVFNQTIYYRLKQTDFDGTYIYFNIIAVDCNQKMTKSLKVYPNPFNNELNIEITGNENEVFLEIFNTEGKVIYNSNFSQKTIISTENFSEGLYLIRVISGREFFSQKVIKE